MSKPERWPAVVIGGGPAGCAAAITLARAGTAVHLIERSAEAHDTVCGGFLGADALARLASLGIDVGALGARPITRLRIVSGTREIESRLPFAAAGLSRRTLDEAMLAVASAAGAVVARGVAARSACGERRSVTLTDGRRCEAEGVFLATGKHELRNTPREVPPAVARAVGLRTSLPASAASGESLHGLIELHLFDGGYAGLLLQEDGSLNLCLSVASQRLAEAGSPKSLLEQILREAPLLHERISGALPLQFTAVAGVPYGWRAGSTAPGVFRVGDQGAVIASLAGDGVAIAVASGQDAAAAFLVGGAGAAQAWQLSWARKCRRPLTLAEGLRRAAETPWRRSAGLMLLRVFPALAPRAASLTRIER